MAPYNQTARDFIVDIGRAHNMNSYENTIYFNDWYLILINRVHDSDNQLEDFIS